VGGRQWVVGSRPCFLTTALRSAAVGAAVLSCWSVVKARRATWRANADEARWLIGRGEPIQHGGDLRDGHVHFVDLHFEFVEAAGWRAKPADLGARRDDLYLACRLKWRIGSGGLCASASPCATCCF